MTTKELIRAEIKKLQDIFVKTAKEMETEDEETVYSMCAVEFGDELLAFLDTLPDDPVTDCHDLTEAAKKYAEEQAFWWIRENPYTSQEYAFKAGAEWQKRKMIEGATYNELMELYRAIRDELVKRHCDVPVNIKEEQ